MADDTANLEQRFASLEEASRGLSLDVQTLNDALRTVAQLTVEQAAQKRRQDDADQALIDAKTQADARENRNRRTFGGLALGLAVILPLASILVYAALISHVNDLLSAQQSGFFNSCSLRNQATRDNVSRENALADANTDPVIVRIHRSSAENLSRSIVNCSVYLRQ